jgi:peptide chain release factor 1
MPKLEITPAIERHLETLLARHQEVQSQLSSAAAASMPTSEFVQLSKDGAALADVAEAFQERTSLIKVRTQPASAESQRGGYIMHAMQELEDLRRLLDESKGDAELHAMAADEHAARLAELDGAEARLMKALAPRDAADERSALLEIRAGTGGLEASLFVQDLLAMYQHHAKRHGWRFEVVTAAATDAGGYREVVCNIAGDGVYGQLKHESGTHRVQRVPATESQGRIHTSTVTVALLPQASEVDVALHEKDLRIDTFRAGGAGGQHVNTTDSAVRITHIPTGVVVSVQDERSQHKNKAKAMGILRARIYEAERARVAAERARARKTQIGTGDRSERIRTYNYAQDRVTDHRINKTHFGLGDVLAGPALDDFIGELHAHYELEALNDLSAEVGQ